MWENALSLPSKCAFMAQPYFIPPFFSRFRRLCVRLATAVSFCTHELSQSAWLSTAVQHTEVHTDQGRERENGFFISARARKRIQLLQLRRITL